MKGDYHDYYNMVTMFYRGNSGTKDVVHCTPVIGLVWAPVEIKCILSFFLGLNLVKNAARLRILGIKPRKTRGPSTKHILGAQLKKNQEDLIADIKPRLKFQILVNTRSCIYITKYYTYYITRHWTHKP